MKDTIRNILLALLAVIIVVGGTYTAIQWEAIVGKWETEAEREVFKQTTTYSEAAASFLADSYKQYNDTETEADKNTIMEYVIQPDQDGGPALRGLVDSVRLLTHTESCR